MDGRHLQCTISLENSWKLQGITAPYNHDAVWVFLKYRKDNGEWKHLQLNKNVGKYSFDSTVMEIETVADKNGVFVKRKMSGSGNIGALKFTMALDTSLAEGDYEFRAYGIEMIHVNSGSFYVGDGWAEESLSRGDSLKPFFITSENEIKTGTDSLSLRDTARYDPKANIPSAYPKGYNGFYCMKYEISQEQYADFLNNLSYVQQLNRTFASPNAASGTAALFSSLSNRSSIVISQAGVNPGTPATYSCNADTKNGFNESDDAQNRACNFLNWPDVAAYLDWAALRPMTELEFEKSCRGPENAIKAEFAWGTDKSVDANTLSADATDSEGVSDNIPSGAGIASYGYTGPQGPLRTGFAAKGNTDRLSSGSGYYGVMEMSGNLWEMCVSIHSSKGILFDGQYGDGQLDADGDANTSNWPGTDCDGAMYRGGAWLSGVIAEFRDPAVSARFYAYLKADIRRNTAGGRGVR